MAMLPLQVSSCEGFSGPGGPFGVVVHPSGERLYVAGGTYTDSVWIVDAGINQVASSIPVPAAYRLSISPSGMLYALDLHDSIYMIDTATHTVVNRMQIKSESESGVVLVNGMGLNGTGTRFYVAEGTSLLVYDAHNLQLLGSVPRSGTTRVSSAPYVDEAYVLDLHQSLLIVRDVEELAEISLPVNGGEIAVHPSGTFAYITNWADDQILVVDLGRRAVVSTITLPREPVALAVHPAASMLYVAVPDGVYAITLPSGSIHNYRKVGVSLWGIAIHPSGTQVYVSDSGQHVVHVLDGSTLAPTAVIQP